MDLKQADTEYTLLISGVTTGDGPVMKGWGSISEEGLGFFYPIPLAKISQFSQGS